MKKKIAAFEMWCWQQMLRVLWTAKRSNASVLSEINEDKSLVHKGTKDAADLLWSRRSKRWPGEDVHVWNGKWREK